MRQSQTAVLERYRVLEGDFATEPYEAGWASEARWFVRVLDARPGTKLVFTTQISPDGLHWCDADVPAQVADGEGLISWPVREFGQWLRIKGSVTGEEGSAKVLIYLTLKE
ncbi:hypothetical protein [Saccharomonospora viridis]|jgi:hypothetical protein|uniref:Uncharacterized protein n=2 Tax=Saccharomonospora viridis TaxID=1852 RepID=C7MPX7_SACVD|nr:hypothetical protein [Saccharomonospora viridis]ACU96372.1 hypothetical protein Svir_13250 [Saccharomonospora viridis DSM 43017]KHF42507.1 hypothetical protein MINT15_27090 [Saccharomonospora viridis]SFO98102.1 hypothetical protein SAMN02982918_1048 [Saccharomonospora viridis]